MNSDPCREDLGDGINRLRKKASENRLERQKGFSPGVDEERVDAMKERAENLGNLDKVEV